MLNLWVGWGKEEIRKMILRNPRECRFLCRSNLLLFPSLARMGGGGAKI